MVRKNYSVEVTPPGRDESDAAKLARIEVENARLRKEKKTVEAEREILQKAAKYFAGAANW